MSVNFLPLVTLIHCYESRMGANVDHSHPEVRRDLFNWVEWLGSQLNLGGLRIDAIKHYSASFLRDFIAHIDKTVGKDWFMVGEYWRADAKVLSAYIEYMNDRISLLDVPLVQNLSNVSRGICLDMRCIFDGSLTSIKPEHAVVSFTPISSYRPRITMSTLDVCCKS